MNDPNFTVIRNVSKQDENVYKFARETEGEREKGEGREIYIKREIERLRETDRGRERLTNSQSCMTYKQSFIKRTHEEDTIPPLGHIKRTHKASPSDGTEGYDF